MSDIGKRIKARRESLGLTQEELANLLGYRNKSTIAKIESGINDIVQSRVVEFADKLNTTAAYLMGWTEDSSISGESFDVSPLEKEVISKLRKADNVDKTIVLRTLHIDDKNNNKKNQGGEE